MDTGTHMTQTASHSISSTGHRDTCDTQGYTWHTRTHNWDTVERQMQFARWQSHSHKNVSGSICWAVSVLWSGPNLSIYSKQDKPLSKNDKKAMNRILNSTPLRNCYSRLLYLFQMKIFHLPILTNQWQSQRKWSMMCKTMWKCFCTFNLWQDICVSVICLIAPHLSIGFNAMVMMMLKHDIIWV